MSSSRGPREDGTTSRHSMCLMQLPKLEKGPCGYVSRDAPGLHYLRPARVDEHMRRMQFRMVAAVARAQWELDPVSHHTTPKERQRLRMLIKMRLVSSVVCCWGAAPGILASAACPTFLALQDGPDGEKWWLGVYVTPLIARQETIQIKTSLGGPSEPVSRRACGQVSSKGWERHARVGVQCPTQVACRFMGPSPRACFRAV